VALSAFVGFENDIAAKEFFIVTASGGYSREEGKKERRKGGKQEKWGREGEGKGERSLIGLNSNFPEPVLV
jgi:hypothetical protein